MLLSLQTLRKSVETLVDTFVQTWPTCRDREQQQQQQKKNYKHFHAGIELTPTRNNPIIFPRPFGTFGYLAI